MMSFIIGLGVILLLLIFYMIFRVSRLVGLAKGRGTGDKVDSANDINAALLLIFMVVSLVAFFWYSFTFYDDYTMPVASEHGRWTDSLFWVTMAVTVIAFSIIFLVLFWFTFKYRYKEGRKAKFYPDNHYLELIWTIVPAIVLAILIFTGLRAWNTITSPASADAEVIEVVAQQFAWTVRYPGKDNELGKISYKFIDDVNEFGLDLAGDKNTYDDFKSLELHIPKGKEVLLKIRAKDVLHSVYIPYFRVKMDAVPGMQTHFKFVVDKTTQEMRTELGNPEFNYEMACAEICGRGHFSMRLPVIVEDVDAYERWKASQDAWLKQNPDQLNKIPANMKEAAMIKAGLPAEGGVAAVQGNVQTVLSSN